MWERGPENLKTEHFVLEPLGPHHNEADFAAWSECIEHIRSTPGFRPELWNGDDWPYPMTLEENLRDLTVHIEEFARGEAFAFTVLDPSSGEVIGCVYIDPDVEADARCRLWVRSDLASLDALLESTVRAWLNGPDWSFDSVRFPGRD